MRKLNKYKAVAVAIILTFTVVACSALGEAVNPYKSKFNCPMGENGKCQSMDSAYNESKEVIYVGGENSKKKNNISSLNNGAATVYQDSVYKKLTDLLEEPNMPVIAPPKVMRALLMPYQGEDKALFMYRFVYFVVDDYSWVLSNDVIVGEN